VPIKKETTEEAPVKKTVRKPAVKKAAPTKKETVEKKVAPKAPRAKKAVKKIPGLLEMVIATLEDTKAEEIVVIDLIGRSSIADHFVIASGRSTRQVMSMADNLLVKLKKLGIKAVAEGKTHGDWVLVDGGDVIIHLFRPEVRSFYNLERMWGVEGPAKPVESPEED
jgi:ribosome-associated protein